MQSEPSAINSDEAPKAGTAFWDLPLFLGQVALTTGKAARLVAGWRGAPPADRAKLADVLHRLSQLAVDLPEVSELDLNPVLAGPDGAVAVDARVRLRRVEQVTTAKTW